MAKGKKSKNQQTREPSGLATSQVRSALLASPLRLIDDRRTFDFEPGTRPARLFSGSTASITATPSTNKKIRPSKVPYQIAFSAPADTLVCVRRQQRREVLFAKNKTGKRGQRRPRRNQWSNIKC